MSPVRRPGPTVSPSPRRRRPRRGPSSSRRVGSCSGSGLGPALGDVATIDDPIAYADLPGFPATTVPGHAGELVLGAIAGVPVAAFRGRFHLYEGHATRTSRAAPALAHALGARTMVLTAAVGAVVPGARRRHGR
jgi:xanthosine phosphorylase